MNNMQMTSDVEILLELPDKYVRRISRAVRWRWASRSGSSAPRRSVRPAPAHMAGGGMMIGSAPAGRCRRAEKKRRPKNRNRPTGSSALARRHLAPDARMVRLGAPLDRTRPHLRRRSRVSRRQGRRDRREERGRLRRQALHRSRVAPAADGHLQGPAAAHDDRRRPAPPGAPRAAAGRGTAPQETPSRREPTDEERRTAREAAEKELAQPPAMVEFTVFFEDWRDVSGVKFPHKMRRAIGGTTNEEWTVTRVKVNPKLDPKKFEAEGSGNVTLSPRALGRWVWRWLLVLPLMLLPAVTPASAQDGGQTGERSTSSSRTPVVQSFPGPSSRWSARIRRPSGRRSRRRWALSDGQGVATAAGLIPGRYAGDREPSPASKLKSLTETCGCAPATPGAR